MTNISIEALKEKTIGEICELVKQAERLPESISFSPFDIITNTLKDAKTQTAQELLDELNMEEKS